MKAPGKQNIPDDREGVSMMSSAMLMDRSMFSGASGSVQPSHAVSQGTNWCIVPRCTIECENCEGGFCLHCRCEDDIACATLQNLCRMLAGGQCSVCCQLNGVTVFECRLTCGTCKCECTEDGCCISCCSGDRGCCDMLQACCDALACCLKNGCCCYVCFNNTPVCCC